MSKLTVHGCSGGVVSLGSLDFRVKCAEVDELSICADESIEVFALSASNPFEASVLTLLRGIERLLLWCAKAKIVTTVIKRIAIDVIDLHSARRHQDKSVQIFLAYLGVPQLANPDRMTLLTLKRNRLGVVNDRCLALREIDKSHAAHCSAILLIGGV